MRTINILSKIKNISFKKNITNLLLVLSFCGLLFLSFFYFGFLIWIAFVPAILLMLKNNFYYFWFYLFLLTAIVSPVMNFFVKDFSFDYYLISTVYYASVIFISFFACFLLIKKTPHLVSIFVFPLVWLLVVNFSNYINGGNFWFNYSFLQPKSFPLIWVIGNQGMTFLIMLVNSLLAFCLFKRDKKLFNISIFVLFIVFLCFIYCSFINYDNGKKIKVALIQGNFTSSWTDRIERAEEIVDTYERLTLDAAQYQPDVIVWPEYAVIYDISRDGDMYKRLSELAKKTNAILIFGSFESVGQTDPRYNNFKNVTNIFSRNGDYIGNYAAVLPFMQNGKVVTGDKFTVFSTDIGRIGITSCSEETYGFIAREYVHSGADLIINLSNDAPFNNLLISKAKAKFSQLSAAENNKYILRATNNGFTEIINPYGKIIKQIEPNKEGYLIGEIYIK